MLGPPAKTRSLSEVWTDAENAVRAAGITDPLAVSNATYDVALTGDKTFIESAKELQQAKNALPAAEKSVVAGDHATAAALGKTQHYRLRALNPQGGGEGGAWYAGYDPKSVQPKGNAPVVLVRDGESVKTVFEVSRFPLGGGSLALRVWNFARPAGIEASRTAAYFLSSDSGDFFRGLSA